MRGSLVMVIQYFLMILVTLDSFGLNVSAKTTLSFFFPFLFSSMSLLLNVFALEMAAFKMVLLYF